MNVWLIDAENIGRKTLEQLTPAFKDKVWVFSRNASVKRLCDERFYFYQSDYEVGANQADFYLIAIFSQMLTQLGEERKLINECLLLSGDRSLKQAFLNECRRRNVFGRCVRFNRAVAKRGTEPLIEDKASITPPEPITPMPKPSTPKPKSPPQTPEAKLLNLFKQPLLFETARQQMKMDKVEFSRLFQRLYREEKIHRDSVNKKRWVLAK